MKTQPEPNMSKGSYDPVEISNYKNLEKVLVQVVYEILDKYYI
jgi:hypothetical protein